MDSAKLVVTGIQLVWQPDMNSTWCKTCMATVLKGLDPQALEVFIVRTNSEYFPKPPSLTDV